MRQPALRRRSLGGSSYDPGIISNLLAWFGDAIPKDGHYWRDQTLNGFDAQQNAPLTDPAMATVLVNGLVAYHCNPPPNGGADMSWKTNHDITALVPGGLMTSMSVAVAFFGIAAVPGFITNALIYCGLTMSGGGGFSPVIYAQDTIPTNRTLIQGAGIYDGSVDRTPGANGQGFHVCVAEWDWSDGINVTTKYWLDGVFIGSNSIVEANTGASRLLLLLSACHSYMCEYLVMGRKYLTSERNQVTSHLSGKWGGISLDSVSPPLVTTTYANTPIIFRGKGLSSAVSVKLGTVALTGVVAISAFEVHGTLPAGTHTVGLVNAVVTLANGTQVTATSGFGYASVASPAYRANTNVRFELTENGPPYKNRGQSTIADLIWTTNYIGQTDIGLWGQSAPRFSPLQPGIQGKGCLTTGPTLAGESPIGSLFCYMNIRTFAGASGIAVPVAKCYRADDAWITPYAPVVIFLTAVNHWIIVVTVAGVNHQLDVVDLPVPLGTWFQVGFTYDGANITPYVNGVAGAQLAVTGNIDWGAHGSWVVGADTFADVAHGGGPIQVTDGMVQCVTWDQVAFSTAEVLAQYVATLPDPALGVRPLLKFALDENLP